MDVIEKLKALEEKKEEALRKIVEQENKLLEKHKATIFKLLENLQLDKVDLVLLAGSLSKLKDAIEKDDKKLLSDLREDGKKISDKFFRKRTTNIDEKANSNS